MKSYCLKCGRYIENINPRVSNTSNGKTIILSKCAICGSKKSIILSKCAICGSKKSRFINNQEAKWLLSNLGLRTPLSKVPLLRDTMF